MKKDNMVAMILAGGRGSRLYDLTKKVAKPAVYFGGKYRIIDFPLSNCANSDISVVGVLTQYESVLLNSYVSKDQNWGLDAKDAGVFVLPPREKDETGFGLYRGTADAITQNIDFLDQNEADYVLILSGDHIYKMDYAKMLKFHKKTGADCTIAVIDVSIEEASRFGIMSTDEDGRIFKFEEKPKHPDSTKASMGIYVFTKSVLEKYLIADAEDPKSSNDFGKNIIPAMLAAGEKMMAYPFAGYWKDVGTIASLWEANMDLLGETPVLDLNDEEWRIYSRHEAHSPQFVADGAVVDNSTITEGCEIYGTVRNSVIGSGVIVEKGATVLDSVILDSVVIKSGAVVNYSIIDSGTTIGENSRVGADKQSAKDVCVIGADICVPANTVVADGAMIAKEADLNKEGN